MKHVLQALSQTPGERLALRDELRTFTYSELRDAVAIDAEWLQQHGAQRVALLADNGAGWVIADLALMQTDALNVPLPAWFTAQQVEHVIDDAGIDGILTDTPNRICREHGAFQAMGVAPQSHLTLLRRSATPGSRLRSDIAKITYTSGSTGAAKGVCLTLRAMEQVALSIAASIHLSIGRHLNLMPLATLLENIAGIYVPLLLGGSCIAPSTRTTGVNYGSVDARAFLAAISRECASSLIVVPELLRILLEGTKTGWRPPAELQFIAVGGAAVAPTMLQEAHRVGLPVYEGYGLSECASVVCLNTPAQSRPGSVGRPLPNTRVRVDEQGQLLVRGVSMSGYLCGEPCATEEIATGDLGEIDADGFVYIRGRLKNMFITSMGRNVSPEWIEAELMRDPAIGQAIVVGESRPWPVCLINPARQSFASAAIDSAVAAANARLPVYAQVRRWARLPEPLSFKAGLLTANGRPRRDAIVAQHASLIDSLYAAPVLA